MTLRPAVGPVTPHLFRPDRQRPVRAKLLHLLAATRVVPHAHPWGQIAISSTGVVRVTMPHGTTIVPPSRALWIPPGVEHAVTVVEDADLLTLYVDPGRQIQGLVTNAAEAARWRQCRVLEASRLLLALALELDARPDDAPTRAGPRHPDAREAHRRPARGRAAARAAGPARHRPAEREAAAAAVRVDARRSVTACIARSLGRRRRGERADDRPAVPQRARHHFRPLARAGAARPCGAAGGAAHADGVDRRRARLRQPERLRCHGQAFCRQLADALLPRRAPEGRASIRAGRARRPTIHADAATERLRHRAIRRLALASAGTPAEDRGACHSSAPP